MALTEASKTSIAFKKLVSVDHREDGNAFYEETAGGGVNVHADDVLLDTIPGTPPASTTSVVKVYTDAGDGALKLVEDTSVAGQRGWAAADGASPTDDRLRKWIPPKFGQGYTVKLYQDDGTGTAKGSQIFTTDAMDWFFDYETGFLSVQDSHSKTTPFWIEAYRYVGNAVSSLSSSLVDADFGSNGIMVRTGAGTYTNRSIAAGSAKLTVTNGDGVAGNPTVEFGSVLLTDLSDVSGSSGSGNVLRANIPTISSPKILTELQDSNGNAILTLNPTASAVNEVQITNAATGAPSTVKVSAVGSDADINLDLESKGTGSVLINGSPISGTGDVVGPASATDHAVARFDTTTGKLIQNSGAILDDSNNLTGLANVGLSGDLLDPNGNELIDFIAVGSAVNQVQITNAATGSDAGITVSGEVDRNLLLTGSGTGKAKINGIAISGISDVTGETGSADIVRAQAPTINDLVLTGAVDTTGGVAIGSFDMNGTLSTSTGLTVPAMTLSGTLTRAADQIIDLTGAATRTLTLQNSTASQSCNLLIDGIVKIKGGTAFEGQLSSTPTANRLWLFPDANGTVALTSDIPTDHLEDGDFSTNGLMVRTAAGSYTNRSIVAGSAKLTVTNGDGVSGNPSVDFGSVASTDLSDSASIVTLTGSQTLTNKTLTTPTIGSFSSATHDHSNAAGGGDLATKYRRRSYVFVFPTPTTAGEIRGIKFPDAFTITEVMHRTSGGSCTFNLVKRDDETTYSGGTNVWSGDKTAGVADTTETVFTSAGISAGQVLVLETPTTASAANLEVDVVGTID